jgi:hypothetical protein
LNPVLFLAPIDHRDLNVQHPTQVVVLAKT